MSRVATLMIMLVALTFLPGCGSQSSSGNTGGATQRTSSSSKDTVDVILISHNDNKIMVIKAIREITGFGLAEAKDLVETAPSIVTKSVTTQEAEQTRQILEKAGATVEVR